MHKRLDSDEVKILKDLYLKGIKIKDIAHFLGISEQGVKQQIRRRGLANRQMYLSEERIDEMIELWRDELTTGQIAIRMGISKFQVVSQLKKLSLTG